MAEEPTQENEVDEELRKRLSTFHRWSLLAQDSLHRQVAILSTLVAEWAEEDLETPLVLGQLNASCVLTSESALLLVSQSRTWDAELLLRPILEGSYRFVAMCTPERSERERRITQYWELLPEAARLRQHARALALLEAVDATQTDPHSTHDMWRPIRDLLLDPSELNALRDQFPPKVRKPLEHAWSFTELVVMLARSEFPAAQLLPAMLHGYSVSSALIHKSGEGVAVVTERAMRSPVRRNSIELAHGARLVADILALGALRIFSFRRLNKAKRDTTRPLIDPNDALHSELREVAAQWTRVEYGNQEPPRNPA